MSTLTESITGFVVGDDLEIRRTVSELSASIAIAWLTVKQYPEQTDEDAALQKEIITDDEAGVGQIENAGGVDVDGELRFDLTQENTTALGTLEYMHDIQIKLTSGKVFTLEKGTLQLTGDVTRSTS